MKLSYLSTLKLKSGKFPFKVRIRLYMINVCFLSSEASSKSNIAKWVSIDLALKAAYELDRFKKKKIKHQKMNVWLNVG